MCHRHLYVICLLIFLQVFEFQNIFPLQVEKAFRILTFDEDKNVQKNLTFGPSFYPRFLTFFLSSFFPR